MKVTTPEIWVSDPCYSLDTWCTHTIKNARLGNWNPSIDYGPSSWGNRVHQITITHEDARKLFYKLVDEAEIGVDSGQAGFFDKANHPRVDAEYRDESNFYKQICNQTVDENIAHSDWYAVSSSGYGDGSYSLYVAEENGEVVAAKIIFIDDNEEDEEFEEEYDAYNDGFEEYEGDRV